MHTKWNNVKWSLYTTLKQNLHVRFIWKAVTIVNIFHQLDHIFLKYDMKCYCNGMVSEFDKQHSDINMFLI
jgi:hypothetical protein